MQRDLIPFYLKSTSIDRKLSFYLWSLRFYFVKFFLGWLEELVYLLFIKKIPLRDDPIIILGHHRSGTTFLQGLLDSHTQLVSPRLWDTLFPDMMVVGNRTIRPLFNFILKFKYIEMELHRKRLHMDFPGEEDVALLTMLNPYAYNLAHLYPRDLKRITQMTVQELTLGSIPFKIWKQDYVKFIKKLQYLNPGKRLLLKSPPHVARPHILNSIFPRAQFIFIMRDPYELYPSMKNFWKISEKYTFQCFPSDKFDELIFEESSVLFDHYFKHRHEIPEEHLLEIRHEDLNEHPLIVLKVIHLWLNNLSYEELNYLKYIEKDAGVGVSSRVISTDDRAKVDRFWGEYVRQYQKLQQITQDPFS